MIKYLAVVVTYNPDENRLGQLLSAISKQVHEIVIYDNNSVNQIGVIEVASTYGIKVTCFDKNNGLSIAYNQALTYAVNRDFSHMLLLDQDSIPTHDFVSSLSKGFDRSENVAVVVPSIIDEKSGDKVTTTDEYEVVKNLINSGSLFRLDILQSINGYDELIFVDYADYEISYRLRKNGFSILRSRDAKLLHRLGDTNISNVFGVKFHVTNHSVSRRFFIAKNRILIYKKYFYSFPLEILRDIGSLFKLFFSILLFEENKGKKILALSKGIYAGLVSK